MFFFLLFILFSFKNHWSTVVCFYFLFTFLFFIFILFRILYVEFGHFSVSSQFFFGCCCCYFCFFLRLLFNNILVARKFDAFFLFFSLPCPWTESWICSWPDSILFFRFLFHCFSPIGTLFVLAFVFTKKKKNEMKESRKFLENSRSRSLTNTYTL